MGSCREGDGCQATIMQRKILENHLDSTSLEARLWRPGLG